MGTGHPNSEGNFENLMQNKQPAQMPDAESAQKTATRVTTLPDLFALHTHVLWDLSGMVYQSCWKSPGIHQASTVAWPAISPLHHTGEGDK